MKKLILSELLLLFLATTFVTDSPPPGWYQQSIPIGNKLITDIQFLDSLNGWAVTDWGPAFDTGYVFKTSNGGVNWDFQYRFHGSFFALQFTDYNTGYIAGSTGSGKLWKTTNGGSNWNIWSGFGANPIRDLFFAGQNTGWVCSDDPISGGVFKTTNGGANWSQQLNNSYVPRKLFFINNDTGWTTSSDWKLYRTTNSGQTWGLQYTFTSSIGTALFFTNKDTGFISGGGGTSGIKRTTNGGFSWLPTNNSEIGNVFFISNSTGWIGGGFNIIQKSTDAGTNWYYQTTPIFNNGSIMFSDTSRGWAGGTGIVRTTDGGGPAGIVKIGNEIPSAYELYQNYPNPFNPNTNIKYQITRSSNVRLTVFDITGRELSALVNQRQDAGTYEADFSGNNLSSGVYFYSLFIDRVLIDTKRMILLK